MQWPYLRWYDVHPPPSHLHANGKVNAAVLANLLQHVVKETKPGGNIAPTTAVQIEADKDIRLFRRAAHLAIRSPANRNSAIRSQSVVANTQYASRFFPSVPLYRLEAK